MGRGQSFEFTRRALLKRDRFRFMKAFTLGALAVVAAAMFALPAEGAFPGANGRVAFDASNPDDLTDQVYTVDRSGTGLSDVSDFGESPAYSPDGRTLVWGDDPHNQARGEAINIAPAKRPERARVLTHPGKRAGDREPAWSPDGRLIAFTRCSSCDSRRQRDVIYVQAATGAHLNRLTAGSSPAWAVTGELAFVKRGAIYTIGPQGRDLRKITTGKPADSSPDWSPDGQWIVFERSDEIYTVPAAGGPVNRLTTSGINYTPAFSPDGQQIVFSHNGRLEVMGSAGGGPTPIRIRDCSPVDGCNAGDPDWQPLTANLPALARTGVNVWPRLGFGAAFLLAGSALARRLT